MDTLDKSDADLEADIANQRKRHELATDYTERLATEKALPKLESVLQKAKQDLADAYAKLQPKVDEAFQQWNRSVLRLDQLSHAESELIRTCRDPQLLEKQREIYEHRQRIAVEVREMDERSPMKVYHELTKRLHELRSQKSSMTADGSPTRWRETVANIEHVEGSVEKVREQVDAFNQKKSEFKNQLADLERQAAEVRNKMLIP